MLRALIILMSMTFASSALAERRVALVIGNSDYQHAARLPNPQNDARAIGDKLSQIGFEVFLHENLGGQQFHVALGAFGEEALRASGRRTRLRSGATECGPVKRIDLDHASNGRAALAAGAIGKAEI